VTRSNAWLKLATRRMRSCPSSRPRSVFLPCNPSTRKTSTQINNLQSVLRAHSRSMSWNNASNRYVVVMLRELVERVSLIFCYACRFIAFNATQSQVEFKIRANNLVSQMSDQRLSYEVRTLLCLVRSPPNSASFVCRRPN